MNRKLCVLIFLLSILFCSCSTAADNPDTFPSADYSNLIKDDCYKIDSSIDALTVLNLFYDNFGYGNFDVSGKATHSESATLIGIDHTENISCNITNIKIYHHTGNSNISSFYVDFINENNEVLSYCYKWQYNNTNCWGNNKTSTFYSSSEWYKKADNKTRTSWNIIINQ